MLYFIEIDSINCMSNCYRFVCFCHPPSTIQLHWATRWQWRPMNQDWRLFETDHHDSATSECNGCYVGSAQLDTPTAQKPSAFVLAWFTVQEHKGFAANGAFCSVQPKIVILTVLFTMCFHHFGEVIMHTALFYSLKMACPSWICKGLSPVYIMLVLEALTHVDCIVDKWMRDLLWTL